MLFGLYLGQRLGDLAKLTWRAVNLEQGEIAFTARKTGRRIVLPLVQPLADYLASLPASDDPNAFIFPLRRARSAQAHFPISSGTFSLRLDLSNRANTKRRKRPFTRARGERTFLPLLAAQRGDDAESGRRF